jgi:hypothetical protein
MAAGPISLTPEGGTVSLFETLVINYHYSLRKNPEEHSSHLLRGVTLKLRKVGKAHVT